MKGFIRMRKSVFLAAAFAALLLVISASSAVAWWNARQAQERVAALHDAHRKAGAALTVIRGNVYLNAILSRDYLLDQNFFNIVIYSAHFAGIRQSTESSFRVLEEPGAGAELKAAVKTLREEFNAYWDPTELILAWTREEKRALGNSMLRQRLSKRKEIFELAGQVEKLMEANFERERQLITTADRDFRRSLGWTTAIALLFGLAIAAAALARMLSLERRSDFAAQQLRLLSGQIRTAQEQERKALSRELHDQVGQMLTALRMELSAIAREHGDAESEICSRIARAKGTVEQTLRIVRNIAMLLRPSMLDDLGLTPAIAWLVKEVSRSSGIDIHSEVDPAADSLPDELRTCVYRVIQEALTNACRHSGARRIEVKLHSSDAWVVGTITDDGRGFYPEARNRGGLGLLGMEERVKELSGSIRVASAPDAGTTVEFRLPQPPVREVPDDTHPDRGRSRDRSDRVEASA